MIEQYSEHIFQLLTAALPAAKNAADLSAKRRLLWRAEQEVQADGDWEVAAPLWYWSEAAGAGHCYYAPAE